MAITINDLKLLESENMTNFSDGGGAMTNNVIIDGASNNIFPDVTEQSRVYGHVEERKCFMAIRSQNNDAVYAGMSYISKLPADEKINVNLAKSATWFDERSNRIFKEKTSIERTIYPTVEHPAVVTVDNIVNPRKMIYVNTDISRESINARYKLLSDNKKSFNCFIKTATSGTKIIEIFGIDGLQVPITQIDKTPYCYGITNLQAVFLNNLFRIEDIGKGEIVEIIGVEILSYLTANTSGSWIDNNNDCIPGETCFMETSVSFSHVPVKKYRIKLTLKNNLTNSYAGADESNKSTWLDFNNSAYLLTLDRLAGEVISPSYTTQEPDTLRTITGKKFYTAKRIVAAVYTGTAAIGIVSNDNKIIPFLEGIVLDDETLGVKKADFIGPLKTEEIYGYYTKDEVIHLPTQNLISIKAEYLDNGAFYAIPSANIDADNILGTVKFKNGTPSIDTIISRKIKITYQFNSEIVAFATGDIAIILNDKDTTGTYTNSQTVTLTRTNLSKVTVRDAANNLVDTSKFTVDLNVGSITFVNVSGLSQPLTITDRIEDLGLVKLIQNNVMFLSNALTHDYPVDGTIVANCLLHGTLQAAATRPFDQQTWTNVWQDSAIGSTVSAQYNFTDYPIAVTNLSAITERWVIIFNTTTTFDLIGEHSGLILHNASTSADLAPNNPHTNHPYFTIPAAGLGGGWSAGNCLRFDTYAAAAPFWILQSIAQGQATNPNFDFAIEVRGEIDAA